MNDVKDLEKQIRSLRVRMTRLCNASLRINESLQFETVLQEVLDSARELTDSTYGVLTTLDKSDRPQDFVTSGITEDVCELMKQPTHEGLLLYKNLSSLRNPLRLSDFDKYASSIGASYSLPFPVNSFLTAPIRHAGETVGNIYLAKNESNNGFTNEDEETLVMFSSQAALVIANAQRHLDERRARLDLEALIETCPVGVAVFDLSTGDPVSFNLEASRIVEGFVESRSTPGGSSASHECQTRQRKRGFPTRPFCGASPQHR